MIDHVYTVSQDNLERKYDDLSDTQWKTCYLFLEEAMQAVDAYEKAIYEEYHGKDDKGFDIIVWRRGEGTWDTNDGFTIYSITKTKIV